MDNRSGRESSSERAGSSARAESTNASLDRSRECSPPPGEPFQPAVLRQPSPAIQEYLRPLQDSSIGATSTNPKVREWSPAPRPGSSRQLSQPADFTSEKAREALRLLSRSFGPIVGRIVRRRRRQKAWPGSYPPRIYTAESVVSTITSSPSLLSRWPQNLLYSWVNEAAFDFKKPKEILVHFKESYISSGLVVLLRGQVQEQRNGKADNNLPERPVHASRIRSHKAPAVLCETAVFSEDVSSTRFVATDVVDVAIIPSRWFWEVLYRFLASFPHHTCTPILDCLQKVVLPFRVDMMLSSYYPTSVVLQRSWMWPLFSVSDRVKLSRTMEVRVFSVGDIICSEGEACPYLFILRRGSLSVSVKGIPLGVVEPGGCFGEVSIILADPRNYTVSANTVSELYTLHVKELHHRFTKYPKLAGSIVEEALNHKRQWMQLGMQREVFGLSILLQGVPCLKQTTDAIRTAIAAVASIVSYTAGSSLVEMNSPCDALFIIGRGSVRLSSRPPSTKGGRPPSVPLSGDVRSSGDYFGEHCLSPHNWWQQVQAVTTVDVWRVGKDDLIKVLTAHSASKDAVEVCRQGIILHQARHLSDGNLSESSLTARSSRATSRSPSRPKPQSTDWVAYSLEREAALLEESKEIPDAKFSHVASRRMRESQPADKENEQAMSHRKVMNLLAVEPLRPHAADCDFPQMMSELQGVIVEQLLLTPTAEQARFLLQLNQSNVKLVADTQEESPPESAHRESQMPVHPLINETFTNLIEMDRPQSVVPLEEVEKQPAASSPAPKLIPEDVMSVDSMAFPVGWSHLPTPTSCLPVRGEDGLQLSQTARSSFSHSFLVRPPSATADGNFVNTSDTVGQTTRSLQPSFRAASADYSQLMKSQRNAPSSNPIRRVSVDIMSHRQLKPLESVTSVVLDRFVKVPDKEYVDAFVKVMPVEQEVLTDEAASPRNESSPRTSRPNILVLLHVLGCQYLDQNEMGRLSSPSVVASIDGSVHLRTPPMKNRSAPRWEVKESSFITFVNRSQHIHFEVRDGDSKGMEEGGADEMPWVYRCRLPISEFDERNGMGQRTMRLFPHEKAASPVGKKVPRLTVTMVAIHSSQYKALQNHLNPLLEDAEVASVGDDADASTVLFQILGVQNLKHRIEAMMTVSLHHDGKVSKVLDTPRVPNKTRNPSWPGTVAHAKVQSDGVLFFHLLHKDAVISTLKIPVDALAFSGLGVCSFPLLLANNQRDVIGELQLNVLNTSIHSEQADDHSDEQLLFLHIEQCDFDEEGTDGLEPDILVVLRNESGGVVLQTPLALSSLHANWNRDVASCFISCPRLVGSSLKYSIEVFDSAVSASSRLGAASILITYDGIGPEGRYDVPFDGAGGKGRVRLMSVCFPVHVPGLPGASVQSYGGGKTLEAESLLLVSVRECNELFGVAQQLCELDPVVTLSVNGDELLRTSMIEANFSPKWSMLDTTASIFIRLRPQNADLQLTFEVFDNVVDQSELISSSTVSLRELCNTGSHRFDLQGPPSSYSSAPNGCRGTLVVETFCGVPGNACFPRGYRYPLPTVVSSPNALVPSSRPSNAMEEDRVAAAPFVRCAITNACQVLPTAVSKCIEVTINDGKRVVLTSIKRDMLTEGVVWQWDEAHTCVDTAELLCGDGGGLEVSLAATLVVDPSGSPATPPQLSRPSSAAGRVLLGVGVIPREVLIHVAPHEVTLFTVALRDIDASVSRGLGASQQQGRPPTPGNSRGRLGGTYLRPNITFSLMGLQNAI